MIKLLKTLIMRPNQLNYIMRYRKPTYQQLFILIVGIMMVPLMVQMVTVGQKVENDLNQLQEVLPEFTIDKESHLRLNDSPEGFVYYSDTFNFSMSEEKVSPIRLTNQLISVEMLQSEMKVHAGFQDLTFSYTDYPQINYDQLKSMMNQMFSNNLLLLVYFGISSFIMSALYLFIIQLIYRFILTAVSALMGVFISPLAFKRLTAVLSIVPITLCAILNIIFPVNVSYLGFGVFLFVMGSIRVFKETRGSKRK